MTAHELAARLPDPDTLRRWCQSLAVLDTVMIDEAMYRYFRYHPAWGEQEQRGEMYSGSGDEWSITFTPAGTYLRGFDHESPLSPWRCDPMTVVPGLLELVPEVLKEAVREPAHAMDGVPQITVSLWRLAGDSSWSVGTALAPGEDGSQWLFDELNGDADSYVSFATGYVERVPDRAAVRSVLEGRPLTETTAHALNPDASWTTVARQVRQLDYPVAG